MKNTNSPKKNNSSSLPNSDLFNLETTSSSQSSNKSDYFFRKSKKNISNHKKKGFKKPKEDSSAQNFINANQPGTMGNGIKYKGKKFITHTNLHHKHSAIQTLNNYQTLFIFILLFILINGFLISWSWTITILITLLTTLYLIDFLFNLLLTTKTLLSPSEIKIKDEEVKQLNNNDLPTYTIFCPLYKEWPVISQFTDAISKIDWPKNKLNVQLLLEEDDTQTIAEIKKMNLPPYFTSLIIPDGKPKTKPKACNYGLSHAKGQYAVIYDAEDKPDTDQLKKAFIAFKKTKNKNIICIQAKLNFYNSRRNLLTRLFTMEYSLWFDLILPGLQSISAPIPLGGTSNHFRTEHLRYLQGWDPFNVTEDCDLGIRISKLGFQTAIIDSSTMEEATSQPGNWIRQRSRWIKGYMQTYLVHMRRPGEFMPNLKNSNIIFFQLTIGGKILFLFINPILWMLTILYFVFRDTLGPTIESFYFAPVYYMAVFSLIFGNFFYIYNYMIGCAKREQWDIIKYAFLVPFYWLLISAAAWKGLIQLITKPHYWEKTTHGTHLKNKPKFKPAK